MTARMVLRIIAGMSIKHYLRFIWLLLALVAPVHAAVSERILLQTSPLAGFQYHEARQVWDQLREGDALELAREPDNVYDPRAVKVLWHGTLLGYVPRRDNEAVARLLDRGTLLEARITRLVKTRNPWQRILFEVYLPL